jgi:hypothetical protein
LTPMWMHDAWSNDKVKPDQWIDANLKQPALQHFREKRLNNPSLYELMEALRTGLNIKSNDMTGIYQRIAQRGGGLHAQGNYWYSLHHVHEELKGYYQSVADGERLLTQAESVLAKKVPLPSSAVRLLGDSNMPGDAGNPLYVGTLYNPYKNRVELLNMNKDGENRTRSDWMSGQHWAIAKPMAAT